MRILLLAITTLMLAAMPSAAGPNTQNAPAVWTYEGARGPAHWSELDPTYSSCSGSAQSPVEIRTRAAQPAELPALHFDFKPASGKLIDNSHAIRVNYAADPGTNTLLIAGKRFRLVQFHFHHPSEETLDGRVFPMDVHFIFESADGQAASVAVMLQPGRANPVLAELWQHLPPTGGTVQDLADIQLDPAALLPPLLDYYTYTGSVTAPPCTEGVTWYILKSPVTLSPPQLAAYARIYPHNIRPVQPLNGRVVQVSRP